MPDEENAGVIEQEEVANPEIADQQPIEPDEESAEDSAQSSQSAPKSTKEDNMRKMGQALDDLKRQNAELQNALTKLAPPKQEAPPEPDELEGLEDDDFVSVAQVRKLAERIVKQTVKSSKLEGRVETMEEKFKSKHEDYDEVVNQDNFEKLFKDMPEMRPVLKRAYELAVKGEDIDPVSLSYKLLKNYSKSGEEPVMKKPNSDERLAKNQAKPLSANAIKSSALTAADKYMGGSLTKADRDRIYKETVEASKARR